MPIKESYIIKMSNFILDGETVSMKSPIQMTVTCDMGHFYAVNEEFEVCGYGLTEESAMESAKENFSRFYTIAIKMINTVGNDVFQNTEITRLRSELEAANARMSGLEMMLDKKGSEIEELREIITEGCA